jgi:hypothetical protein
MLKTRQNKNATRTRQNATLFEGYGMGFLGTSILRCILLIH